MPNKLSWRHILSFVTYLICLVTIIRFVREAFLKAYPSVEVGYDFRIFFDAVQQFLRSDSFNPADLRMVMGREPIVFPPQILFILPFALLGEIPGAILFFVVNVIIAYLLFRAIFKHLNIWTKNPLWLLSLCLFFNSNSLIRAFYMGQTAFIAVACLLFAMLTERTFVRAFFLAIAIAAKYSLIPLMGFAFLIIRDIRTCFLAALLFLVIAATPALFGHNLYSLYQEYFFKIVNIVGLCGVDTYCGGGSIGELLNFDFFKIQHINIAVKSIFLFLFGIAVYKEYLRAKVSLNFLIFAYSVTLIIAYHRFYDMAVLQLLMIALVNILLYRKQWVHSIILGAFILFSVIPFRWLSLFGTIIGEMIGRNPWIYFESFGNYPIIFPTYGVYMFLFTCYAAYLYFRGHPTIEFLQRRYQGI